MKSWTLLLTVVAALALTGCGGISMTNTTAPTFTIGGTVSGMASGTVLVLQDNNANNLTVNGNVSFTFPNPVPSGTPYNVTVLNPPTGQTCSVANGSGTATANISNVTVTCATSFTISAAVTGLASGGTLVLEDNPTDKLTFTTNTTQTFGAHYASGAHYAVGVVTQPSGQTCTLSSNSSGTITSNVTIAVTCTSNATLTISAAVTGLTSGGTLVLQDNTTDQLTFTTNTTLTFATKYASGATYAVTVVTQPTGQTCTLGSNSSGTITANVTVAVTCAANPTFTISAAVTGLASGTTLVLQDNPTDQLTFTTNTTQTFATQYPSGATYAVTVVTQPSGQTCTLGSNSSGTITANITVAVTCSSSATLTISAAVTGLASGTTLVLQDNPTDQLTFTTNTTQTFATKYASGATYAVTVVTQPAGQTCTLGSNASGTITANVTVAVTCASTTGTLTISAAVTGLASGTLVLQDNPTDQLTFTTNTTQTFATKYVSGATYAVTVVTQPAGQTCTLGSNASGIITANVTVAVTCSSSTTTNQWNFINGAQVISSPGTYPSKKGGTGTPGARHGASTWIDSSGTMWLFGGLGYGTDKNVESFLNDLWKFSGGVWIWVAGSNNTQQAAIYPTALGGAGTPGARAFAVSWIDSSNNLWFFGGFGLDALNFGPMNDLWEFNGTQWLWQGGSQTNGAKGIYPVNTGGTGTPGARYNASGAKDSAGNFWLFGGSAIDSNGGNTPGDINDLWEFTGGQWIWVSGAKTINQKGTYPASTGGNGTPGARQGQVSWMDASNNFWIFGGDGADSNPNEFGYLNDTWEFMGGQWVWQSGSNVINQPSVSLGLGITDPSFVPASREYSSVWLDPSGDVWIFGGQQVGDVELNDLWKFSGGEWTWESGSEADNPPNPLGIYTNPGATPGARQQAASWADASGNLWLFGGFGWGNVDSTTSPDGLNDLWEFTPGPAGPAPALPASQVPHAKRRHPAR